MGIRDWILRHTKFRDTTVFPWRHEGLTCRHCRRYDSGNGYCKLYSSGRMPDWQCLGPNVRDYRLILRFLDNARTWNFRQKFLEEVLWPLEARLGGRDEIARLVESETRAGGKIL